MRIKNYIEIAIVQITPIKLWAYHKETFLKLTTFRY